MISLPENDPGRRYTSAGSALAAHSNAPDPATKTSELIRYKFNVINDTSQVTTTVTSTHFNIMGPAYYFIPARDKKYCDQRVCHFR